MRSTWDSFGHLVLSLLFTLTAVKTEAQIVPENPSKTLVTVYPSEQLESTVYQWPGSNEISTVPRILASGGTTHLRSLKIRAMTLGQKQSLGSTDLMDSENLIIVKEGRVVISIQYDQQELGPGSVALILPGEHAQVENLQSEPATFYLLEYQSKATMNMKRAKAAGGSLLVDWNRVQYQEHDKGGRRDFFDRPTAMCEDFEMHVTNLNEGTSSHAPHTHQVEEIILMVQGKISMHIDGKEIEASAGDFAFVDSMVPHAATNIGKGQAIYFAFQWK